MKKVFISYRRDDSAAMAGRLYDSLSARFGPGNVFFDVDTIGGGIPFRTEIASCLEGTGVLLAVIGSRWYEILRERAARPESDDFVAIEISTAHEKEVPVIPVLVSKQAKQQFNQLVKSTATLATVLAPLQTVEIDEGKDYRNHVDRLIGDIESVLGVPRARRLRLAAIAFTFLLVFVLGYALSQYLFKLRYSELPQGAVSVGLRSIEDRNNAVRAVPPEVLFRSAKREVFMSGVSCYRSFDQQKQPIDEIVANGIELYVLIMDPNSEEVARLSSDYNKPIASDIRTVIAIIKEDEVFRRGKVHLRLMSHVPPFSAVMIDGNVESATSPSLDPRIRVQPYLTRNLDRSALILEFGNNPSASLNGFEFFATDIRRQWAAAAPSESKLAKIFAGEDKGS